MEFIGVIVSSIMNIMDGFEGIKKILANQQYLYRFHSLEEMCRSKIFLGHSMMDRIEVYANIFHRIKNPEDKGDFAEQGYIFCVYTMNGKVYVSLDVGSIGRLHKYDFPNREISMKKYGPIRHLQNPENVILSRFQILIFQNKKFALINSSLDYFMHDNCSCTVDFI